MLQELDGSLGATASMQLPDNITSSTSLELYLRLSCNGALRVPCLPACTHTSGVGTTHNAGKRIAYACYSQEAMALRATLTLHLQGCINGCACRHIKALYHPCVLTKSFRGRLNGRVLPGVGPRGPGARVLRRQRRRRRRRLCSLRAYLLAGAAASQVH